ncbi:unnamed protein product, partial [Chrysoparadoxa australica]
TNATIAGPLSLKQPALVKADRGAEAAMNWLEQTANADVNSLNSSIPASGYYANYGNLNASNVSLDDISDVKDDSTWTTYAFSAGQETDTQNAINYIIERMCTTDGAAPESDATNKCQFGAAQAGGGSKQAKTAEQAGAKIEAGLSPVYRVTVRVTGPKNTQSYSQLYVY